MSTTENNRLIAEFMEFKQCKGIRSESGKYFDYWVKENFSCIEEQEIQIESEWGYGLVEQDLLFAEQLKFHIDWNWLMQVVDKIDSLCRNTGFEIYSRYAHIRVNNNLTISSGVCTNKIESVYNACVEFIKWYNEQPK
jgi:hypothetical protein